MSNKNAEHTFSPVTATCACGAEHDDPDAGGFCPTKADLWLQEYEPSGEMGCGCTLEARVGDGPAFWFCPLHAAAQELLDACKAMRDSWGHNLTGAIEKVNAAIAKSKSAKANGEGGRKGKG